MRKHTKIYLDYALEKFNLLPHEITCEVCRAKAVDIHHIDARGMGGSKFKDTIENLMALCRRCHNKYGDKKKYKQFLHGIHKKIL